MASMATTGNEIHVEDELAKVHLTNLTPGTVHRPVTDGPRIMTMGCGGAGNNGISRLIDLGVQGMDIVSLNTDWQALQRSIAPCRILIGKNVTFGKGTGGDPLLGKRATEVSRDVLETNMKDVKLLFLVVGLGGGTGTGAAPVIASIARHQGASVIALVTMPFTMERERIIKAKYGLQELKRTCNCVIKINNNSLMETVGSKPLSDAFLLVDQFIAEVIKGLTETITLPSLINLDLADLQGLLSMEGKASIAFGESPDSELESVISTVKKNPLIKPDFNGAKAALVHLTVGPRFTLLQAKDIGEGLTAELGSEAEVILGARIDPTMGKKVRVIAIATGIPIKPKRGPKESTNVMKRSRPYSNKRASPSVFQDSWGKWDIPTVR